MTYIPTPIVIPSSSGGNSTEYVYPFLPQFIAAVGGIGILFGICGIVICLLADMWGWDLKHRELELFDGKWWKLSATLAICGFVVFIIGLVMVLVTGQPIESEGK